MLFEKLRNTDLRNWLYRHISILDTTSQKQRVAILFLSAMTFIIEPHAKLTLGKASLAGLGVSLEPSQTIQVGLVLLALLCYRLISFWMTVTLNSGVDSDISNEKAQFIFNPAYGDDGGPYHENDQLAINKSRSLVYSWTVRKIIWEVVVTSLIGTASAVYYLIIYLN